MAIDRGWWKWHEKNSKKSPCYMCKEQHYKCHGSCEEYLKYSQRMREEQAALRKNRNAPFTHSSSKHRIDKKWSRED